MAGRVRPLVPFFVSAADGTLSVNDPLLTTTSTTPPPPTNSTTTTTTTSSTPPLVHLPVRTWDHSDGVFRDSVHLVRDLPHHPRPITTPPPKRLLTPAEIRAARRKKKPPADLPTTNPPTVLTTPVSLTHTVTPPHNRSPTPVKTKVYAGSTFEAASPPPGGLPIPSFAKRCKVLPVDPRQVDATVDPPDAFRVVDVEVDAMEKAALDLRRMLRI